MDLRGIGNHRIESREEVGCDRRNTLGRLVGANDGIVACLVETLFKARHAEPGALKAVYENNGFFVWICMPLDASSHATLQQTSHQEDCRYDFRA
jgi:hypothetical protein